MKIFCDKKKTKILLFLKFYAHGNCYLQEVDITSKNISVYVSIWDDMEPCQQQQLDPLSVVQYKYNYAEDPNLQSQTETSRGFESRQVNIEVPY